jgi:uncharacterized phage protein gp47/JayE
VSFIDRNYSDIVVSVLTNLTGGVSQEHFTVNYDALARPVVVPDIPLKRRPVKRVSMLQGFIEPSPGAELIRHTFSLSDYELVGDPGKPEDLYLIRFLPFGRKPASGTQVTINYYPRTTEPTPLTDLNVGSVARTMVEAMSREMALLYNQLNRAYDSAFLETAEGASLDRVVALLGYKRYRAGRPVGTVSFKRRRGAVGSITIPAGTPVTDTADKNLYLTVETGSLLENETTAQIAVRGATDAAQPVKAGALTVVQRSIAGVEAVTNEQDTNRASEDETDEQLRARARDALIASNKGTVGAIVHGLLQLPEVRDVKVVEMPNGVPGEIGIAVSLDQPATDGTLPRVVRARIEELRPAGIRILSTSAGSVSLQASVQLTLAGSTMAKATIDQIRSQAIETLVAEVRKRGVGEKIRVRSLAAAVLRDSRIVDALITLTPAGGSPGAPGEDFQPDSFAAVQLAETDVRFDPELFDQPLGEGDSIAVEVNAVIYVTLSLGVPEEQAKAQLKSRLSALFENVVAGTTIDADTVLTALRDDARYAVTAEKLKVSLESVDQHVEIRQSGPAFTVLPRQVFAVASVDVRAESAG